MRHGIRSTSVSLAVGLLVITPVLAQDRTYFAQDRAWRPGAAASAAAVASAPLTVSLGRPQPLTADSPPITAAAYRAPSAPVERAPVVRGQSPERFPAAPLPALGVPQPAGKSDPQMITVRAAGPPPGSEAYNSGVVANPIPPPPGPTISGGLFGCEWLGCTASGGRKLLESDHCFDHIISPVTNPFLFEDPRSLTEIRPLFLYQKAPGSNIPYNGGHLWFLGTQARLAITERLSLVLHKLGGVWSDPNNPAGGVFAPHVGFAEVWVGPKLTIIRNDLSQTLLAAGANFQIPAGDSDVFQDTGSLSVVPYVTFGQHFLRDFNFMTTIGYAAGDNQRTDYLFNSYHLSWDVGGLHRFFPLIELNWFHYTKSGAARALNFEGRDLINFGANAIATTDSLTLAIGFRYKFNDFVQLGLATEFPLIASKDLLDFRLATDVIFRY